MQDQVTNRIELIMQDKTKYYASVEKTTLRDWCKGIVTDVATISVVIIILALGSGW
ncbi:MAG: hypothetical protein PSN04_00145 [Methyloprofundus sp.]|nr:hypothetical protein [Methyloprofundus sp.]